MDQQRVQWSPSQRTGRVVDEFPLAGETWCVVESDGWWERQDLREPDRRYYQREQTSKTPPCILTIRKRDLAPAAEPPVKPAPSAGLREDAAAALATLREILARGLVGPQRDMAISLERTLLGIQAQAERG